MARRGHRDQRAHRRSRGRPHGRAGASTERRAAAGARPPVTTPSRSPTCSSTFPNRWRCCRSCAAWSTDGGWVAIKVPCGPAQLLKETWRARLSSGYRATLADNLVHINHFSPRALRAALERGGLSTTSPWRLPRPSARRSRALRHSSALRCTTSDGACPVGSTRQSRCTCRPSHVPRPCRDSRPGMTDFVPNLSVVIPTYNNEAVLRRCLDRWQRFAAACASRSS